MFEYHGWINLRLKDDEEAIEQGNLGLLEFNEKYEIIVNLLQNEVTNGALSHFKDEMKITRGLEGIAVFHFSNIYKKNRAISKKLTLLLDWFIEHTSYSYGLIYVRDGDISYDDFQVFRLAKDKVTVFKDGLLSPTLTILGEEPFE